MKLKSITRHATPQRSAWTLFSTSTVQTKLDAHLKDSDYFMPADDGLIRLAYAVKLLDSLNDQKEQDFDEEMRNGS